MGVHPGILEATSEESAKTGRIASIDALRGLVMVLMLLDHLRETWFLHMSVADPMDARTALPALYLARLAVSLCAPIFIALTGLAAYLFSTRHTLAETRAYLVKRGLVLMALEVFYLSELYWGVASPTLWLQVIWCIGVCMIVLAAMIGLPRSVLLAIGMLLVCGHNLLDPIQFRPDDPFFAVWAMLHQRDVIALPFGLVAKTTYPVLPWIGVILLGYAIGSWFLLGVATGTRERRFAVIGVAMLVIFAVLRLANGYGDKPWFIVDESALRTAMSFFALTKYPPSLLFLLLTLGSGALLLIMLERMGDHPVVSALAVFGGAPLFFYLLHLTVLRLLYHGAFTIWGATQGTVFAVANYAWVLVWYAALIPPLYFPTACFSRLKASRRDIAWLKYL
ncbi:heparan-alpha-glucosaminide N-acetyltransferase domain-containing protein [Methylobacterium organophilum]|nr:heparan-alpha-glucosaminide N-acetyltransferase domain-containing protein [Methylobacterium organophilum]